MSILFEPIITEKSMTLAASGWFTFKVDKMSRKEEIAKAVAAQFKVDVVSVKTMIVKGGTKRTGKKRIEVSMQPWKKALVKLKKDQKIDLFESSQAPAETK